MPSSEEYLLYIKDLLSGLPDIKTRKMMGEYILYYKNAVVGGIYDDRLLIKPTQSVKNLVDRPSLEIPYPGAKPLIMLDTDDKELIKAVIIAAFKDLSK